MGATCFISTSPWIQRRNFSIISQSYFQEIYSDHAYLHNSIRRLKEELRCSFRRSTYVSDNLTTGYRGGRCLRRDPRMDGRRPQTRYGHRRSFVYRTHRAFQKPYDYASSTTSFQSFRLLASRYLHSENCYALSLALTPVLVAETDTC